MNRLFHGMLNSVIRRGRLEVTWPDGRITAYGREPGRSASITLHTPRAARALLTNPELKLGELYMSEEVSFAGPDGLVDFLVLVDDNDAHLRAFPPVKALKRLRKFVRPFRRSGRPAKARRNIAHHYDIDVRLYRLFLDSDLQYSCGYFAQDDASIEKAQEDKKRHIAAKLGLGPNLKVLDIGCGWGGLALTLSRLADVDVTGVSLSTEQTRIAKDRAQSEGLDGRTQFLLQDYRSLKGEFDRIVSVGMFEHVGAGNYGEFFRHTARLLAPKGVMLLHSIGRTGPPGVTNPWADKYIFPGAYVPALSEVLPEIERAGLIVSDVEILRLHYAQTLKAWRARFREHWQEAAKLFDERFCRMWDFYLASSEAAFRSGYLMVFQIQLVKDITVVPQTRGYMSEAEQQLEREPPRLPRSVIPFRGAR